MINADELDKVTLQVILDRAEAQRTAAGLKSIGVAGKAIGDQVSAGTGKAKRELAELEQKARSLRDQVSAGGDVSSNLSALSALSRLGGADLGIVQDVTDLVEQLPLLKQGLTELPSAALSAAQALGPAGIAGAIGIGALLVASKLYLDSISEQSAALSRLAASQEEYFRILREGTTKDAQQRLQDAQQELKDLRDQRAELQTELDQQFVQEQAGVLGDLGARIRTAVKTIGDSGEQAVVDRIGQLDAQIASSAGIIERLTGGLEDNVFSANDTAQATETLTRGYEELQATLRRTELQTLINLHNLDADSAKKRIEALENEIAVKQQFIYDSGLSRKEMEKLTDEIITQRRELAILRENLPALETAARLKEQEKTDSELADAARDYEQKRQSIIDDGNTAALRLQEQYADKVVNITQKFADDIERATEHLQERSAELARDVGRESDQAERDAKRERIEEQIAFNQETAKQARDLERELLKIKRDSQAQEADLVRNRDFAGISKLREERNRALDDAVSSFNVEQRERETAFKQQQQQTNRQLEFEAETRRIQFEQAIKDAQLQFETERAIAFRERDKQLKQLQASTAKEAVALQNAQNKRLQLLQDGTVKELKLIQQGEEARLRLRAQADALYLQMARNLIGGIGGLANTTNNTLTNANTFNITSGGGAQQQAGLVNLIAQVVNQQLGNFFN